MGRGILLCICVVGIWSIEKTIVVGEGRREVELALVKGV
jgi:hypothetical protein